jgi:hypothetical protein
LHSTRIATTTRAQGQALENLVSYVFVKIPGVSVTRRNALNVFATEEIDVAFWNEKDPEGIPFLPNIILVECKNWGNPVGSSEVSWFDTKLRNRGLSFGVLVALNGITGDAADLTSAHSIIASSLREQRNIVVITSEHIMSLSDTAQLIRLFKEKLCELAVTGTAFT